MPETYPPVSTITIEYPKSIKLFAAVTWGKVKVAEPAPAPVILTNR